MSNRPPRRPEAGSRPADAWAAALQHALDTTISEPAITSRNRPLTRIISVSQAGTSFEIELRFESGGRYCCAEPGCFLATDSRGWWNRFRLALGEVSERDPPPLAVTIHGVIEAGAIFEVLAAPGACREPRPWNYRHGPDREQDARD